MDTRPDTKEAAVQKMERLPMSQELISYYQVRGLDNAQASLYVIKDLQNLLLRSISSSRAKDKLPDAVTLAVLEMKLASKPWNTEAFTLAGAVGATVRAVHHVVAGGINGNKH